MMTLLSVSVKHNSLDDSEDSTNMTADSLNKEKLLKMVKSQKFTTKTVTAVIEKTNHNICIMTENLWK